MLLCLTVKFGLYLRQQTDVLPIDGPVCEDPRNTDVRPSDTLNRRFGIIAYHNGIDEERQMG